jgi:AcrR family transcriptional regulator
MTEKNIKSRQAIRSIKMLQNAFIELLEENPYEKIKVSEITSRADLARSTFYAHFETKDDLVESFFDEILTPYFDNLHKRGNLVEIDHEVEIELQSNLFRYWGSHCDVLCVLRKANIDKIVLSKLRHHFKILYENRVSKMLPNFNPVLAGYHVRFITAATYSLLLQWMENDRKQSPEVMGRLLYSLTVPNMMKNNLGEFTKIID